MRKQYWTIIQPDGKVWKNMWWRNKIEAEYCILNTYYAKTFTDLKKDGWKVVKIWVEIEGGVMDTLKRKEILRDCPFCKKRQLEHTPYSNSAGVKKWWVECKAKNCWVSGPHRMSRIESAKAWNGEIS